MIWTACAGSGGGEHGSAPHFITIGSAPPGGTFFVVGSALADVLNQAGEASNWQVTSEATQGSQENIRRLDQGELDLALSNSSITYFGVRGGGAWERPYPVRAVMTLAPNVALFVAPKDSGIRRLVDLKGKRVVVGPAGAGFKFFIRPLLAAHGVTYDDFTPLNNTQAGAVNLLSDGSAAAAFLGGAVPTASITQASISQPLHFIPYEARQRQQLLADYLFFAPATIPAGTYPGQEEEFQGLDVGSMHLITSATSDPELIYAITRLIYENRESLLERHPAARAINPRNVVRNTGTEFHGGAIRYYREIGIWPNDG